VATGAIGPRVVALGGGHGLSVTLAAVRRYTSDVTAVVSVADDGGSSGRLRRDHGGLAPGDLRKCLVALADPASPWRDAFGHRFRGGDLDGHALGNIVLVGLAEVLGDYRLALAEALRLLGGVGRVLPATTEPVVLTAHIDGRVVEGQAAVHRSAGRIRSVALAPPDAPACPEALAAIAGADQVVLAPGSLFTSIVPVLCVGGVLEAVRGASGRVVHVGNLQAETPETSGLTGTDQVRILLDHGARIDVTVSPSGGDLETDADELARMGVETAEAAVSEPGARIHDPAALAVALRALL